MKLAYFTNTYPRATDTFIRREVIGLRKRGFDVLTYSVHKPGANHDVDEQVISEKQSTHYLFPLNIVSLFIGLVFFLFTRPKDLFKTLKVAYQTKRPGIKGFFLQLAYFAEAILLARQALKDQIDHLHNHFGDNSGNVTLFASLLSNIPFSISIHGPHIFFDAIYWALDVKTKYAAFICVIGAYCRSQMMLYTDVEDWHKFQIIRCGIDPELLSYSKPDKKIEKLLYVGRLDAEKGVPILFNSIQILNDLGHKLTLTLLGDGAARSYLEQLAVDYKIESQVEFKGFVNQDTIAKELRSSDLFVLPSFAEGIPVSFMEAMAVGVPVVGTNVAGVSELVINGETGLISHASDSADLAQCIKRYLDDPQLYLSVAEQARKKVETDFAIEDQVDKLATLFSAQNRA